MFDLCNSQSARGFAKFTSKKSCFLWNSPPWVGWETRVVLGPFLTSLRRHFACPVRRYGVGPIDGV